MCRRTEKEHARKKLRAYRRQRSSGIAPLSRLFEDADLRGRPSSGGSVVSVVLRCVGAGGFPPPSQSVCGQLPRLAPQTKSVRVCSALGGRPCIPRDAPCPGTAVLHPSIAPAIRLRAHPFPFAPVALRLRCSFHSAAGPHDLRNRTPASVFAGLPPARPGRCGSCCDN